MDTEKLLSVQEAAAEIGVSQSAIRNATLHGRLPFVVKFRRKLIEREALAAYRLRTQPDGVKLRGRPHKTVQETPTRPVSDHLGQGEDVPRNAGDGGSSAEIAAEGE